MARFRGSSAACCLHQSATLRCPESVRPAIGSSSPTGSRMCIALSIAESQLGAGVERPVVEELGLVH